MCAGLLVRLSCGFWLTLIDCLGFLCGVWVWRIGGCFGVVLLWRFLWVSVKFCLLVGFLLAATYWFLAVFGRLVVAYYGVVVYAVLVVI